MRYRLVVEWLPWGWALGDIACSDQFVVYVSLNDKEGATYQEERAGWSDSKDLATRIAKLKLRLLHKQQAQLLKELDQINALLRREEAKQVK